MNTSISTTNLSVRAKNALHGAGIHTVEQLKATPFEQLRKIRNMGKKSLTEVEDFLQDDEDDQPLMASQATLRDYFAAKANEKDIEQHRTFEEQGDNWDVVVRHRSREEAKYCYADAMLKAREQ